MVVRGKRRGRDSKECFFFFFKSKDFSSTLKITSVISRAPFGGARSWRSLCHKKMPALSRADRERQVVMSSPLGDPRCGCCGRGGGGEKRGKATNKDENACSSVVPLLCPCCASLAARPSSARLVQLREARERSRFALEAMRKLVEAKVREGFFLEGFFIKPSPSALLTHSSNPSTSTKKKKTNRTPRLLLARRSTPLSGGKHRPQRQRSRRRSSQRRVRSRYIHPEEERWF